MLKKIMSTLLLSTSFSLSGNPMYLIDSNHVRYELYQENEGSYNWLFFPGGPGADSSYFHLLIDELAFPGKVWLVDLPGNGSNTSNEFHDDFDQWLTLFPKIVNHFDQPIVVGHSFGGMLALLFPELEEKVKGLVILNSSPALWFEEAFSYAKQFDLPSFDQDIKEFTLNPNQQTFEKALEACIPYYFSKSSLEKGKSYLASIPFRYEPAVWGQKKVIEIQYSAKWIPENVPTLILGAKYDCMCPFSLFEKDQRFHRTNIQMHYLEDAGHFPWIENPKALREKFDEFISQLN